jgi:hypothetical protein
MAQEKISVPSSSVKQPSWNYWPLEIGPTYFPEMLVTDCQCRTLQICNMQCDKMLSATFFFFFGMITPQWVLASSFIKFLDHTQWHTTVGRTPLDEWSAHRRDLWQHTTLTTDIHASGGISTHDLSRWAAVHPRLRPRGHWDQCCQLLPMGNYDH